MAGSREPKFDDERDSIRDRAKAAGIEYVNGWSKNDDGHLESLILFFSDGTDSRSIIIDSHSATSFAKLNFENLKIIGPYSSLYDREDKTIEAVLLAHTSQVKLVWILSSLPGAEYRATSNDGWVAVRRSSSGESSNSPDIDSIEYLTIPDELPQWRLPIADAPRGLAVEISPPSEKIRAFAGARSVGSHITIKISGFETADSGKLADQLESITASVLFELDVRFGVSLSLQYRQNLSLTRRPGTRKPGSHPVRFPSIRYPKAPTTLYSYAKSATENPLQQYLAYYQAIEHYWPTFVNRDAIGRVRNTLRNPNFDRESDDDISRLIIQAGRDAGRGPKEIDQLKTTLFQSVDRKEFEEWVDSLFKDVQDFLQNNREISGIKPINMSPNDNRRLSDQIADRVYAIRCRIVHAKDSDNFAEPLLPYSKEASLLKADLLLIEYLCQRVIIAGSSDRF